MEIYWGSGSPYAWRVTLAAEIKRIPWDSKLLEFSKGDLKTPAYLAMNPRGKVPVLRDGDVTLAESLAIVAYLDRKYPEPPLFGRTPEETGRVWHSISSFEAYMRPHLSVVSRWFFGDKQKTADEDTAATAALAELATFEQDIAIRQFITGDMISTADLVWYPFLRILQRANDRVPERTKQVGMHPIVELFPHIGAWFKRVEALPGFDKTFPPHWRS